MTIDMLLSSNVPLPLSRHGYGPIGQCSLEDLRSAQRCIERLPDAVQNASLKRLLPIIRRLRNALKKDVAANTVSDLRIFTVQGAIKNGLKSGAT